MIELGQLEARHEDFSKRGTRVVAVSLDSIEDSANTQKKFPHLIIVSDEKESLAKAAEVMGPQRSPSGGDAVAPTTVFIDRSGEVSWVFRPSRFIRRLSPDEVLKGVDDNSPPAS